MSNITGKMFTVTTFGSSHGKAIGAVIDGCPAGLSLNEEDIQIELNERKPGQSELSTSRKELDKVQILSGVFEGKTDGTPILGIVFNKDAKSSSYDNLKDNPRPGHGDLCWTYRYGIYDYRGGGRGSGRNTIGHVIAGAIAKKILKKMGIEVVSHVTQIKNIKANPVKLNLIKEYSKKNSVRCSDLKVAKKMEETILKLKKEGNSVGGVVETVILGLPIGLGEPIFNKLDADLTCALMNIGSVKGVEIGSGFKSAELTGYEMNDEFYLDEKNRIKTTTNNSGGILGGMSTSMPIIMRMSVKPTPSISIPQKTVNLSKMEETEIIISGRHDPCICPRIVPVAESAVAIVLVDHLIRSGFINPCKM